MAVAGASPAVAAPAAAAAPPPDSVQFRHLCAAPTQPEAMRCHALVRTDISPLASAPNIVPPGYGPSDLRSAYSLPATGGAGATVAVVDAYDDPNAEADLAVYRAQYGLAPCTTANGCFSKINENGSTSPLPAPNAAWAGETSLDLDTVSAVCPSCKILLVEANSSSLSDLGTAVNTAVRLGAKYVSNSYGGSESSYDPTFDSQYFNHPGVAITVSAGDAGYGVEYPAASRYVTAVGGTSLIRSATTRGWSETVWGTPLGGVGTGSGCSAYDAKPSWQSDSGCPRRTVADVSAVADPATGVAVYDTYSAPGWQVYGGTSVSAPLIAGVYALAGTPTASTYPSAYPYTHLSSLYDVTSGANGSCGTYLCTARAGYDGPTGLGTPHGTAAFVGSGGGTPCTAQQLLGNPGFENDTAPWTATPGVVDNSTGEPPHSGSWKAWLDGYGTTHTDTLAQQVSIGPACTTANLSFWLHIDTADTGTTAHDTLKVELIDGTTVSTLATYSNLNAVAGYTQRSFSLCPYIGKTITLRFTGVEDASLQTSFVIDDTALNVS
ncbi:S53 family peptidase [Kitasatospora sp. GP82]|uniref:S53 family peptidase n=1 Tax=Kitasatospora sp. GP82 TaxID=3035089 RepID=UPI0024772972|nr:S53 family peptidase [Kitasatospora sp. GP82]